MASVVTFAYLGYFSNLNNISIDELPTQGLNLVFITYPAALSTMKGTRIWIFAFFLMLTFIGINNLYGIVSNIETILMDMKIYYKDQLVSQKKAKLVICVVLMAIGLVFSTRSGFEILSFINSFVLFIPLAFISFMNFIIFCKLIRHKGLHI